MLSAKHESFHCPGREAEVNLAFAGSVETLQAMHPAMLRAHYDDEPEWLQGLASSEAFAFLAAPAEDIYTVADGEPFRDAI